MKDTCNANVVQQITELAQKNDGINWEDSRRRIRIYSNAGNVDQVFRLFKQVIRCVKINFCLAEIDTKSFSIDCKQSDNEFYPLKLYDNTGLTVMISEVRTGYQGLSVKRMTDILKLAGFELTQGTIDNINNKRSLKMTITRSSMKLY